MIRPLCSGVLNLVVSSHVGRDVNVVPDDADRWPDELRLSDIEDRFVCGGRGADERPDWQTAVRRITG